MFLDTAIVALIAFLAALGCFRGFIREIFGIAGIALSIVVTMGYHDYFLGMYAVRVRSEAVAGILSGITVFVAVMMCAVLVNGFIVRVLAPLRSSTLDRAAGFFVGLVKGVVISYFLFFITETFLYVFAPPQIGDEEDAQVRLPTWFANTYSYNFFSVASEYVGGLISEPAYGTLDTAARELLSDGYSEGYFDDEEETLP